MSSEFDPNLIAKATKLASFLLNKVPGPVRMAVDIKLPIAVALGTIGIPKNFSLTIGTVRSNKRLPAIVILSKRS